MSRACKPRSRRSFARRRALAGSLVVLVVLGIAWQARRHWPGQVTSASAAAHGAEIVRYDIRSRFVARTLPQTAALPRDAGAGRPLLVLLHGRGEDGHETNSNGRFYAALDALGDRAPAVVFPNGGVSSYWHDRASGDWGRYVLEEVIPQAVRRLRADPARVAIGGISMGGYGAYAIAARRPGGFCAVAGHSPAFWLRAGDSADGAFDDADDYRRNDVLALARAQGRRPWRGARLWLDSGDRDPFRPGMDALAGALRIPARHPPGGHDGAYVDRQYARWLRFYAGALARC